MLAAEDGGIFVSYRRQESSHLAGRLADRLASRFGEGQVFIDVDTIEPGVDFAEEIFRAVAACEVLLAVIGPSWLTATDERSRRRLDDPDDIVRLEIEAALARGVRVIPILVEGAIMPGREDLPESLARLARLNALRIRHESFRYDAGHLVAAIERVLEAPGTAAVSAAPDGVPPARNAFHAMAQKDLGPVRVEPGRAAHDSDSSDGTLTGARLEAAIQRLGRSGVSPNVRTVAEDLRSLGYQYIPAKSTKGASPENYLRAIDSRRGATAVAYLTPTYLEFTPFALQLVPRLASLPGAEVRDSGVKFSHILNARPARDAAKLYMEQGRKAGAGEIGAGC
jgi:hypothetical protein